MTVISDNGHKLVNDQGKKSIMTVRVNGTAAYGPGVGIVLTAAKMQTALNTFLGHSGNNPTVSSFNVAMVHDKGHSLDGAYYGSWDGTGLLHFVSATGVEAGVVDLSAVTKDVYFDVEYTQDY